MLMGSSRHGRLLLVLKKRLSTVSVLFMFYIKMISVKSWFDLAMSVLPVGLSICIYANHLVLRYRNFAHVFFSARICYFDIGSSVMIRSTYYRIYQSYKPSYQNKSLYRKLLDIKSSKYLAWIILKVTVEFSKKMFRWDHCSI